MAHDTAATQKCEQLSCLLLQADMVVMLTDTCGVLASSVKDIEIELNSAVERCLPSGMRQCLVRTGDAILLVTAQRHGQPVVGPLSSSIWTSCAR